jgi:ABC-type Fe3+ transport system permease subunit
MWLGSDPEPAPAASTALLAVLLVTTAVFVFGYRVAVNRRANADYKATKAAVPKLRRGFWSSWWGAVKMGFWMALAVALLVSWAVHESRQLAGG